MICIVLYMLQQVQLKLEVVMVGLDFRDYHTLANIQFILKVVLSLKANSRLFIITDQGYIKGGISKVWELPSQAASLRWFMLIYLYKNRHSGEIIEWIICNCQKNAIAVHKVEWWVELICTGSWCLCVNTSLHFVAKKNLGSSRPFHFSIYPKLHSTCVVYVNVLKLIEPIPTWACQKNGQNPDDLVIKGNPSDSLR